MKVSREHYLHGTSRGSYALRGQDETLGSILRSDRLTTTPLHTGEVPPIPCPCCNRPIENPPLDVVVDRYRLSPLERRIFGLLWRSKGMPVITERIFDAMYADDPDGGPSHGTAYKRFKVALFRLRARLEGSGIAVETIGNGRGYRLIIGERK